MLILWFALACGILAPIPAPPAIAQADSTSTFTPTLTATIAITATTIETSTPTFTPTPTFSPPARRVLILSIDGLRPDAIYPAPMPNLIQLMQGGAFSLHAQTIHPSLTLPAHASMLTGMCPSKHGVDWNDYLPGKGSALGTDIFDLAHAAGLKTVVVAGKRKLTQVTEPASLDTVVVIDGDDLTLMDSLIADFPQDFGVLFVHLPDTDTVGHEYGWLSREQLGAIQRADEALGQLLAALDARGLRGETLIIVTSDHGGFKTSHGTNSTDDMTIPWIASGPGILPTSLTTLIHTMDTAATAAFALGLPIPAEWDGVPVYEAFGLPFIAQSEECE